MLYRRASNRLFAVGCSVTAAYVMERIARLSGRPAIAQRAVWVVQHDRHLSLLSQALTVS